MLFKIDLNHKSCPLSWVIVQIYKFDHDFAPFFAPISYHYVLCALFSFSKVEVFKVFGFVSVSLKSFHLQMTDDD